MKKLVVILAVFTFCISQCVVASSLTNTMQFWPRIHFFGDIKHSKWRYLALVNPRFGNDNEWFDQLVNRVGLGYAATSRLTLWAGTDVIASLIASNGRIVFEQRTWQRVNYYIVNNKSWQLLSRTMLEQRFLHGEPGVALRLQQRIAIRFPDLIDGKITPEIYDEVRFNLNHPVWISTNSFNQNRFFVGFRLPAWKHTKVIIGYMNQLVLDDNHYTMNHVIWLALTVRDDID